MNWFGAKAAGRERRFEQLYLHRRGCLKGQACAGTDRRTALSRASTINHTAADGTVSPPLFTDNSYENLGLPTNPRVYELAGGQPPDLGLGGRLNDALQDGKFKVPTLRNVAKSAPYGHNGYFATLAEIVNFYNTRDVANWPEPEVADNLNTTELGNLGLTPTDEGNLVSFLKALSD